MASLATTDELGDWIGEAVANTARAQLLLDVASQRIRGYCRQTISQVLGDTVTMDAAAGDRLYLPERPATAVSEITVGGATVAPSAYVLRAPNVVFRIDAYAWDFGLVSRIDAVQVTYDHGFADVPPDVKGICLDMAARAFTFRSTSESPAYGEDVEGAGFGPELTLYPSEKRALTEGGYRMPAMRSQNITAGDEREVGRLWLWPGAPYGEE